MTAMSGPLPRNTVPALITGRATATMTAAARVRRRMSSQSGDLAALSSRETSPKSRRTGGKRSCQGAGGVILSSHHRAGRTARAARAHGAAKESAPRDSTAQSRQSLDNAA